MTEEQRQPPAENAEFWTEQTTAFSDGLETVAAAFRVLVSELPAVIQQAADLGLMREQHDMANVTTAVRGDAALNIERDDAVHRLEARVAAVESKVDKILAWMEAHP